MHSSIRPSLASTRPVATRLALALTLAFASCAPAPAPFHVDLAALYRPGDLRALAEQLEREVTPARPLLLEERDGGLWLRHTFADGDWQLASDTERWHALLPVGGAWDAARLESLELSAGERSFALVATKELAPGQAAFDGREFQLRLEAGTRPSGLALAVELDQGRAQDGRWRFARGDLAADGIPVLAGVPARLTVALPRASALVFHSVAPAVVRRDQTLAPTTFRVRLDGVTVFEERQESTRTARAVARRVKLDAHGGHELTFEIDGPGPALFAGPALVPDELGAPGARPWPESRPDLVLVLCDTFRADNLAAWGGPPDLAPALNAFVERALHFRDARATAAWTLPSIGTLMSGVFPGMHGGTDIDRPVSLAVETLAEVLARSGYRTAAVTDAGFFSRTFRQDQGFQWFEEFAAGSWSLTRTLERARAVQAADDGRPLFLVVHTYRVHGPMRLGPEEDPRPWSQFLASQRARVEERKAQGEHVREIALDLVDEGRRYYLDSVRDLDRKVGAWLAQLEDAGFYEHGVVLLTADHGNAYGEHEDIGHGGKLWDIKLAVPLALRGVGLAARAEHGVVSLIDVAPTLAELARATPSPSWLGRSLLAGVPRRPAFAFSLDKNPELALFADGRKVLAPDLAALAAGQPTHAFDLGADPGELTNLAETAGWPRELAQGLAGALEPLLVPIAGEDALELSPEFKRQLQAIGYGSGAGR